jgi:hypothetical protein
MYLDTQAHLNADTAVIYIQVISTVLTLAYRKTQPNTI